MSTETSALFKSLRRLKHWSQSWRRPDQPSAGLSIERYAMSAPSDQNALDIFEGAWASRLPDHLAACRAGESLLFEDERISWMLGEVGGVAGQRILELGPLEAGHTYMLDRAGAGSILAIEANTRAYLKCLLIKELLGLPRACFRCGDFIEYLRTCPDRFDLCVASGVLYHMREPAELIALAARVCDRIFLWTHYFDPEMMDRNANLGRKFSARCSADYEGFRHTLYRYDYGPSRRLTAFCGGGHSYSHWMPRADILACLQHFGFSDLRIHGEDRAHTNGPCFCVLACR